MSTRAYLLAFLILTTFHTYADDLVIRGEVKTPLRLSLAEITSFPSTKLSVKEHSGDNAIYEGVALTELLHRAGVPQGQALRGDALRLCVIVKAADGYQAVFTLAELDPQLTDKHVPLAIRRNENAPVTAAGLLRVVVPDEKRQVRWVRQVKELEITRVGSPNGQPQGKKDKHL